MDVAVARLERLEIALGGGDDVSRLRESLLAVQANIASLEKQYPALAELSMKHGAQARAIVSGTKPISDAAQAQIILVRDESSFPIGSQLQGKEGELRSTAANLQEVQLLEQYLNAEPLQAFTSASGPALSLYATHAVEQTRAAEVSAELQARLLAYNELILVLSKKFAQLDEQLRRLEQRVAAAEGKIVVSALSGFRSNPEEYERAACRFCQQITQDCPPFVSSPLSNRCMAFKFNFGADAEGPAQASSQVELRPGRLVQVDEAHRDFSKEDEEEVVTADGHRLRKYRLRPQQQMSKFPQLKHITQRSDLEPAVYEGGFKLWECSLDLIDWLAAHVFVSGLRVLELGCGHGLPGIWCLTHGASVDFADYNEEVLVGLTIPNVQLCAPTAMSRARFLAGDWSQLGELAPTASYDLIIASEVLYFVNAYTKLLQILERCVRPTGKILIASKLYYFSCGGGTRQFESELSKAGSGGLQCKVLKRIEDQQSNIREILQLCCKEGAHES